MLLKRLELVGFKSFVTKTVLEFPAGITAIVGPNGSGKSNVIDSIRWLLGERDAKNIRGARVEDLIFAGTPQRPRVGQAQARLIFDNRTKFFPLDYTEIEVARKISRDGTSEYFLNDAEVRLKEFLFSLQPATTAEAWVQPFTFTMAFWAKKEISLRTIVISERTIQIVKLKSF